jgi:uracil phosphoribosyltransferase
MPEVHVIAHPLVQHKLTLMRDKNRSTVGFRQLLGEIAELLAYDATRDLPLTTVEVETPLEAMHAPLLAGRKPVIMSILRAGNGLLDGMLHLIPSARVAHIGLYRDPATLMPVEYYFKVPDHMDERHVIVVDPMLATGHSAAAAITRLKATKPLSIRFICLLAAPEGLRAFHEAHPDVPVYTASVDRCLNDHGYILPGLGDAGDRMYGTR